MLKFGMVNKVFVQGNLVGDVELRETPSGTPVADVAVATSDRVKRNGEWENETTFIDVTVWGNDATNLKRFSGKGKNVLIVGRLKQERWQDKQTGANRSKIKVVADEVVINRGSEDGQDNAPLPTNSNTASADGYAQALSQ